ncbi:MAG: ABC transporter permease [Firmicutes bacterium]|nr:ABC transporter permease [Bacillota bacterium]
MKQLFRQLHTYLPAAAALALLVLLWQLLAGSPLVPGYLLPAPTEVLSALVADRALLLQHSAITLQEALIGLAVGVALGFIAAVAMDALPLLRRALYPLLVISQTIPTVAIAPLLVLWFGYEMLPKIILIVLTTFFPITVGLLAGFAGADRDGVTLLKAMGATRLQIFRFALLPAALPQFFAGLRIAAAYAVVGAVISEWLGGFGGLGVYMTRVRKAFAFDKMFAVIILIALLSLALMGLVALLERRALPHLHTDKEERL